MQRRARAYGPYKHGSKFRVHIVVGSGADRTTTYEVFASRADAQRCVDGANDEAQGLTVRAAVAAFIDAKRAQGRAELTIVAYEQRLRMLLADYLSRPIRSVVNRGGELYAAALEGRSVDGHQNLLTAGRLWARWCVKRKLFKADPFADVEPVGQRIHGSDKVRLTADEARRLEAWCIGHPSDQGAILTLGYLYLGARNTELGQRSVRDLDDNGRVLRIVKSKSRSGLRSLRLPDVLAEMLRAQVAGRTPDTPIFVDSFGHRLSSNAARAHVKRVCDLASVPVVPPQALRRTWTSLATEAGEAAIAVARHLGHGSVKVAQQSYIDRDTSTAASGEAVLRVIRGGRS